MAKAPILSKRPSASSRGAVAEALGTKNLVADAMYRLTGNRRSDHIAQDTVAMIVDDMISTGALPLSVAMHLAVMVNQTGSAMSRDVAIFVEGLGCLQQHDAFGAVAETPTPKALSYLKQSFFRFGDWP